MIKIANKKGDIASIIYILAMLLVIAFVMVFGNKFMHDYTTKTEAILNSSSEFQNSSAITALQTIRSTDDVVWDWAFLAIYVGGVASLIFSSYLTRISGLFYWFYIVMSLIALTVGVMLSNAWQKAVENPILTDVVARFPITNFLLGTYAPLAVTAMILLTALFLFAKTPENSGGIIRT